MWFGNKDDKLIKAVKTGAIDDARKLIDKGANVNAKDKQGMGYSPLMLASYEKHGSVADSLADLLIESGADIHDADAKGITPLMMAAVERHHYLVKLLLLKGVDANAKEMHGKTAYDLAKSKYLPFAKEAELQTLALLQQYITESNSKHGDTHQQPGTPTDRVPCDICGIAFQSRDMAVIPLQTMQQAARSGFNPYDTRGIDLSQLTAGLSETQVFAEWWDRLMQDTTDWHLCMKCANVFHQSTRKSGPTTAVTAGRIRNTRPARVDDHYVLECIDCGFTHHIPSESVSSSVKYSVDMGEVKMICVFGGEVTVTLEVKDFFSIKPVPQSRQVLHTSISNNMVPLHSHMLLH